MKSILFAAALLASQAAWADGFVCSTTGNDLSIKVYDHTQAQLGTRNVAAMIVSDPTAAAGQKTIARFQGGEETLVSHSATFTATLDPSAEGTEGTRLISGVQLDEVKTLTLDVYYDYNAPAPVGAEIGGELTLDTTKGTIIRQVECTRYRKSKN